jgi:hypothetical protein
MRSRALLARGMAIDSVAVEVGFFDQSHLTNRFNRLCSAKLMRPSRGLWDPAILVMQSTENGRCDHSASRWEVMAVEGHQRVLCG